MRQLDHENVIKLHEVHETSSNIFLVLEILSGGDIFSTFAKKFD